MENIGIFVDVSGSVHNTPQVERLRNTLLKMAYDFQRAGVQPPSVVMFDMTIVHKFVLTPPETRLVFSGFDQLPYRSTNPECIRECFNRWCKFGIILTDGAWDIRAGFNKNVLFLDLRDDNIYFQVAPNLSKLFI